MPRPAALACTLVLALAALLPAARAGDPPAAAPDDDGVLTVLCFSGGGTRAAAFACGAARGLAAVDAGGAPLLERVDRVVGVSGGSLTAAQVVIDRSPEGLDRFERTVLRDDLELAMVRSAAGSGYSLVARDLTRCDVAAGCFDRRLLGTTFAALPARPELWVQATDVVTERPFVLSRESLAALGLDPAEVTVGRAVSASAAFPGIFPPARLAHPVLTAGGDGVATVDTATVWLADGGIVDNLGLEPTIDEAPPPGARAVVLVVVDARCGLGVDAGELTSSVRAGLRTIELQQRRLDDLLLARARDRLRLLELEARAAGRDLETRLVVLDFAASARREALDRIGTRFALSDDEVTLLLEEGEAVARARAGAAAAVWAPPSR
jgi:predicted acylesterase/phospholipase RssA